jgi:hypothetical protein
MQKSHYKHEAMPSLVIMYQSTNYQKRNIKQIQKENLKNLWSWTGMVMHMAIIPVLIGESWFEVIPGKS